MTRNQNIKITISYSHIKGVSLLTKAEFDYELGELDKGYNNRTLYINVSDNRMESKPVDEKMKEILGRYPEPKSGAGRSARPKRKTRSRQKR